MQVWTVGMHRQTLIRLLVLPTALISTGCSQQPSSQDRKSSCQGQEVGSLKAWGGTGSGECLDLEPRHGADGADDGEPVQACANM